MTKHQRPQRIYDFTASSMRMAPIPGDRLDAELNAHAAAITHLQLAIEAIDRPITEADLHPSLLRKLMHEARASLEQLASDSARAAGRAASAAQLAANASVSATSASAPVLARAEALLNEERQALARLEVQAQAIALLEHKLTQMESRSVARETTLPVGVLGPNAGGFYAGDDKGATATAADYAEVSEYWAEWMGPGGIGTAGHSAASDIIPGNILAINAITGDHWSSRWWAHRAAEAVGGQLAYLYLGPYPSPPLTTPSGGQIPIGAIYWNTSNGTMYVWNGTSWLPFNSPTKAATSSLFYSAAAGQTVFNLGNADMFGSSHILKADGSEGTEIYFNGVRLTPVSDYSVDPVANTMTLVSPAPAGSVVGIDVMTDPMLLAPVLALTGKLLPWTFDGMTTTFPLLDSGGGTRTAVDAAQLFIVIDGVDQEPGVDFTLDVLGTSVIFLQAPTADAKSFAVMMFRTATGFLSFVTHDNTLTGDGTVTLPLGVVNATANSTGRGAVYVPGLAGTVPNHLTINALTGELGATTALQTQIQAGTDAIQPVTSANLRGVMGAPVSSLTTVQKTVVPAINEINAQLLYRGVWQVAANSPNLTPPLVPPAANGWTWTAQTANPAVPEIVPAGITGIVGQTVATGDHIVWTGAAYTIVPGSSLTRPQADLLYVNVTGDTMTGELHVPVGPPANDVAVNKLYVDNAIASNALYRGPWQVAANNPDLIAAVGTNLNGWSWIAETVDPLVPEFAPAGMPGIGGQQVDSGDRIVFATAGSTYQLIKGSSLSIIEGDARYLNTAGDTATGPLILAANPVAALEAATKAYVDASDNLDVLKAGDTMTGQLNTIAPVAAANAANKGYVDAADALNVKKAGDTMTGQLLLVTPPVGATAATSKTYVDTADALRVLKAGDVMTGQLTLPATAPVGNQDAATKIYVDTAIASGNLYQGQWQVAANIPNLTPPTTPVSLNGYSWIAQTVDPNIPETAPAGLPGIGGQTIFNGDTIRWNSGLAVYERFQGSSLTIAQADTLYVKQVGDTMTGYLLLNADPVVAAGAATKNYVDVLTAAKVSKAGDVMTGQLELPLTAPTLPQEATNKQYVDQSIASASLYQGTWQVAANAPDLTPAVALPLNGYSWIAQTVDPNVSEPCPAGITGIPPGTLIDGGSTIRWSQVLGAYELIKGPTISLATATAQLVDVSGDTMTGGLTFNGQNIGVTFTGGSGIYSWTDKALTLRAGATPLNTQPRIIDNNGANARDILDTKGGQHIAGTDDFLSVGLRNGTAGVVPGTGNITGAYQIRMGYNNQAGATYGHEIRSGHHGSITNNNQIQFWLWQQTDTPSSATPSGHVLDIVAGTGVYLPTDGHGRWFNGAGGIYKKVGSGIVIREHAGGTQPQIEDNNGTNARDIIDTVNGDARYMNMGTGVLKAGDTMTGLLTLSGAPTSGLHAATKTYVDTQDALQVTKTGDTMTGTLTISMGANANGINLSKNTRSNDAAPQVRWFNGRGGSGQMAAFVPQQAGTDSYYSNAVTHLECWTGSGGFGYNRAWYTSQGSGTAPDFNISGDCYARGVKLTSDASLKEDIRPISRDEALKAFEHLKPVRFKWRPGKIYNSLAPGNFVQAKPDPKARLEWGFLADDVEQGGDNLGVRTEITISADNDGAPIAEPITEEVKTYDLVGVVAILTAKLRDLEEKLARLEGKS